MWSTYVVKHFSETTLCLKIVPTFKFFVTLSNLNRYSKFLHCWKAYEICYKTAYDILHLTLGMLLPPGKLKIQISADIRPMWKKMQAYCILIASNFVIRDLKDSSRLKSTYSTRLPRLDPTRGSTTWPINISGPARRILTLVSMSPTGCLNWPHLHKHDINNNSGLT